MLKLVDLSKSYGNQVVLDQINLEFKNSEGVYGLLGRNGAGKTTMMQSIFQMLPNYQGDILFQGQNIANNAEALGEIAYVGHEIYSHSSMFSKKISSLVDTYAKVYRNFHKDFAMDLVEKFKLDPKQKYKKLSTGNRTIVQNILGLASRSKITIFDEPTRGLDSVNREKFFQYAMEDYSQYPRMFILSTHLINEIQNYLTDVVILKDSRILIDQPLTDILAKAYRVTDYALKDKNIVRKESLAGLEQIDIYDHLSSHEINEIISQGGQVTHLDLQTLFNGLMEE